LLMWSEIAGARATAAAGRRPDPTGVVAGAKRADRDCPPGCRCRRPGVGRHRCRAQPQSRRRPVARARPGSDRNASPPPWRAGLAVSGRRSTVGNPFYRSGRITCHYDDDRLPSSPRHAPGTATPDDAAAQTGLSVFDLATGMSETRDGWPWRPNGEVFVAAVAERPKIISARRQGRWRGQQKHDVPRGVSPTACLPFTDGRHSTLAIVRAIWRPPALSRRG